MATVGYNGQSFTIDGRRLWVLGASLQYARIHPEEWAARIADARQAGFNTIETACPWMIHEPREGRYEFTGEADVGRFVTLCGEADMRVILRAGPYIGAGFDGGGLPSWLAEGGGAPLRVASERLLKRVSRYFRKLFGILGDLQASKGGPILLVQVEHDWTCANEEQAEKYLGEVTRIVRESGIAVPFINTNNLWVEPAGTIDAWRGDENLLINARQLRAVQSEAPRIVCAFESPSYQTWGEPLGDGLDADTMLVRLAEILAAGAQPVVTPFHGGSNFGFAGGRVPSRSGAGLTTSAALKPPLGEAGARGRTYHHIRRLVTFARHFSHVFSDLDPDYQPVAVDPGELDAAAGGRGSGRSATRVGLSVVPLRGAGGRVVFVFGDGKTRRTSLLLDSGVRLPIDLGTQPVAWLILEADLHGRGRLDYVNLCPFAIVDRSLLVLFGAAGAEVYLSIDGTPLHTTVPTGRKPAIIDHRETRLVICNQTQIDAVACDDERVYVGVDGFDVDGTPRPATGWSRPYAIARHGDPETLASAGSSRTASARRSRTVTLKGWRAAPADDYRAGTSPRYASLREPKGLTACGAAGGYGWYRIRIKTTTAGKRLVHAPLAGDRLHLFVEGEPAGVHGVGPGATAGPWSMTLAKGPHTLVLLADDTGRFADGLDLGGRAGLWGHLQTLKAFRTTKPKVVEAPPVDPFEITGFIPGAARGQGTDAMQVEWSFKHARKTPILVETRNSAAHGVFVLNDVPIAHHPGDLGPPMFSLLLDPASEAFRRGNNVLRFAPLAGQPGADKDIIKATTLYECAAPLTDTTGWAFAKWEPPAAGAFEAVPATQHPKLKGHPCWWRCTVDTVPGEEAVWLDLAGMSKGQAFVNGHDVGRYFTATATGRAVGPQTRLYVPRAWLHGDRPNDILVFDEHGFSPSKMRIAVRPTGDLDGE